MIENTSDESFKLHSSYSEAKKIHIILAYKLFVQLYLHDSYFLDSMF